MSYHRTVLRMNVYLWKMSLEHNLCGHILDRLDGVIIISVYKMYTISIFWALFIKLANHSNHMNIRILVLILVCL